MVKSVIYVEGGGDTGRQRADCRKAFSSFFNKAGLKGRMVTMRRLVPFRPSIEIAGTAPMPPMQGRGQ